jgi:lactate dehydrogenase-like 2-hydroxyacid dehydrogenase
MDTRIEFADVPLLTGRALAERMRGEEVVITNEDHVDDDALIGNGSLKLLGTPSAGLDHIDVKTARKGIEHKIDSYRPLMDVQLKGTILGIVGVGNIGTCVAMIAGGFGIDAVLFDPGGYSILATCQVWLR